ncbi:molybdopterin oxidoreductase family protein [Sphingobium abikonense]|uniref:molybdopterin oxidoreductase family protein n=1 Tax=Sphingobium abikonense TaxID=86193 RepID=UPI003513A878
MAIVRSLCGECAVGCGIRAVTEEDRILHLEGDAAHPANGGLLCAKAKRLRDACALDGRLLHPIMEGRRQSWERTIAQLARRLAAVAARHGPGSVALHVGGGLSTEDYYVANKLMKGFLGSAHIHAPWRGAIDRAQRAAFGEDVMPTSFEDIGRAGLILLAGDAVATDHPVLFDRVQAMRAESGAQLVMIAPEGAAAGLEVDLHLPVAQEAIAPLLNGLLLHVHDAGLGRVPALTPANFWEALRPGHDIWSVARTCGLSPQGVRDFYDLWASQDRALTLFSGEDGAVAAATINLHVATGRIARPGAGPFALGRAANGMGAREVGCLADTLAAHRDFTPDSIADAQRFWGARTMAETPGLEGAALLQAIRDGAVRVLISIGDDMGAMDWLAQARSAVALSIRASAHADAAAQGWTAVLPAPVGIEQDGTMTALDRLVSRQRRLFDLPGEARSGWWMLTRIAQAMGWGDAFHYERPADIYREHVRLTAYGNSGERVLNLKRHAPISNPAYAELTPWRWGEVPFDDGRFPTPDGRAHLLPLQAAPEAAID